MPKIVVRRVSIDSRVNLGRRNGLPALIVRCDVFLCRDFWAEPNLSINVSTNLSSLTVRKLPNKPFPFLFKLHKIFPLWLLTNVFFVKLIIIFNTNINVNVMLTLPFHLLPFLGTIYITHVLAAY